MQEIGSIFRKRLLQLLDSKVEQGAVELIEAFAKHCPEVARHGLALIAANVTSQKISKPQQEEKLWEVACKLRSVGLHAEVGILILILMSRFRLIASVIDPGCHSGSTEHQVDE